MEMSKSDKIQLIVHHLSDFTKALDHNEYGILENGEGINHACLLDGILSYSSWLLSRAVALPSAAEEFFNDIFKDSFESDDYLDLLDDMQDSCEKNIFPATLTMNSFIDMDNSMIESDPNFTPFNAFSVIYTTMLDMLGARLVDLAGSYAGDMAYWHKQYITSMQAYLADKLDFFADECAQPRAAVLN